MFPTALKGAGLTAFPFNPALILSVGLINLLRHKSFYRLTEQLSYALLYCTHSCCCRSTRLNIFLQADDVLHLQWTDWFLDPCTSRIILQLILGKIDIDQPHFACDIQTQECWEIFWLLATKYLEHLNPSEIRCVRFTNFVMYFCHFMYFYNIL